MDRFDGLPCNLCRRPAGAPARGGVPVAWLEDYRATYVERDVRQIVNVIDRGPDLFAVEAKSGETAPPAFFEGLAWWRELLGDPDAPALLVYGGDESFSFRGIGAASWRTL